MCFHNSMSKKAQALAARYGRKTDVVEIVREIIEEQQRNGIYDDIALEEYRATAFPVNVDINGVKVPQFKKYPIITADDQIQVMQWGLIPFWLKPKSADRADVLETVAKADGWRRKTYNARSETVFTTSSYRAPINYRRCIIPSTGYFEYHYPGGRKTNGLPYFIFIPSLEIFSMAGIFDEWVNPLTGERITTFSMLTTEANEKTRQVHNGGENPFRMPLILSPKDEERWLDTGINKKEKDIKELLKVFPADGMDAYPVEKERFRKMDVHDERVVERDEGVENVLE